MKRRRMLDRLFTVAMAAFGLATLCALFTVVGIVVWRGAGAISPSFLLDELRGAGADGGVFYHIAGTAILVATAALVALPISIAIGLMSHGYLGDGRGRRAIEAVLHALNAVPSIVFGLAGLALFVNTFRWQKSWLAGGIVLGLMIVPTVAVAFLEKLRAIPAHTIEAASGLGLRRSMISTAVLLPQAASGLVTGLLLGLARAAGETAPIMFTAVIFSGATIPHGIDDSPVLALPYHIFVLAQDSFDPAALQKAWGAAAVLVALVFGLAIAALPLRLRIHEEAKRV
ncbi:MAG: ABC transporter permease subunit [Thermoanaerobaculia bacterium]|jgi:phosphate transport system permease protein